MVVALLAPGLQAGLDPNRSQSYPDQGYALIICGNTHYGWEPYDQISEELLRDTYLILTTVFHFDPNNVWVLANSGEDDWTQGLFDAQPADKATVAETFRTIGQRMWMNARTPRNLMVFIAGHGARSRLDPPTKTQIKLADGPIWDDAFVADANNPIAITMDTNPEVTAVFKCGDHPGQFIPLPSVGALLGLLAIARRRPR
jgi:hypothetical protein